MNHTALAAATLAMAAGSTALAHENNGPRLDGAALMITAEANVAKQPDVAQVTAGVLTEAKTADAALADNAAKMNGLMRALRQAGVAERDVQTSNLALNPQYVYTNNETPRLSGYQASNIVTVRVRDLKNLGRTLDSLVGQGGNQVQGISFSIEKADEALDGARQEALRKARARADLYAEAAGMRVSRIVSIQEGGNAPMPMPMMAMRASAEMAAMPTPVAPGEVSLSASVTVLFELK